MMICLSKDKDGADILIEYLGGTLDAARSAELERHAQDCADCRKLLAVWNTLDAWEAPPVSPDFDARLFARLAREEVKPWWRRMLWRPVLPLAVAGALLAAVLMVHVPSANPVKPAHVDPEMEQVEQTLADLELLTPLSTAPADRN